MVFVAVQSRGCRHRVLSCLVVGWIALMTMLGSAGTASASNPVATTTLPLASYRDMVVDPTPIVSS